MFIQQMDDIKRHGPPTSYDEDSFEKNHGRIRDQIFIQNQKARSRDTAERYAQHILCSHIVTGGFFKDSETWYILVITLSAAIFIITLVIADANLK